MVSFVSATLGISVSALLIVSAWARGTPWDRALYHAALIGGAATVVGRFWVRQMIRAAMDNQKRRNEEETARLAAEAAEAAQLALHGTASTQSPKPMAKA